MAGFMWRRRKRRRGATSLEYALLVVLAAITISYGTVQYSGAIRDLFADNGESVQQLNIPAIGGGGRGDPHDPGGTGDPHDDGGTGDPH